MTAADILKQIKDNDVKIRRSALTDPKGKLHHVTMDMAKSRKTCSPAAFDGSSIAGWKAINNPTWF